MKLNTVEDRLGDLDEHIGHRIRDFGELNAAFACLRQWIELRAAPIPEREQEVNAEHQQFRDRASHAGGLKNGRAPRNAGNAHDLQQQPKNNADNVCDWNSEKRSRETRK